MNKAFGAAAFIFGAAIGSVATWYLVKTKYEQIAQEEIDSVKEVFSKKKSENISDEEDEEGSSDIHEKVDFAKDKPNIIEYTKHLEDQGYVDYSKIDSAEEEEKPVDEKKPYVIPPEEFGEAEYDTISLTYYSDHILADDLDEMVEDVENTVTFDALNHFGEYEDDSVYVRNDRLQADFEILLDNRKFSDVIKLKPHQRESL